MKKIKKQKKTLAGFLQFAKLESRYLPWYKWAMLPRLYLTDKGLTDVFSDYSITQTELEMEVERLDRRDKHLNRKNKRNKRKK